MTNSEISQIFSEIADRLMKKREDIFKIRAYQKVARTIAECPEPVEKLAAEGRLREIEGVGEAIEKKIKELVTTGKLTFLEKLRAEMKEEG
jgi:DNA polymerase (family 10)